MSTTPNITTVMKVDTRMGYASVTFRDTLNGRRTFTRLYRRLGERYAYYEHGAFDLTVEHRQPIIERLAALQWHATKACLADAPWIA